MRDVLKHYDAETRALLPDVGHYRGPAGYSEENLKRARASLERLYAALRGTDKSSGPGESSARRLKRAFRGGDE